MPEFVFVEYHRNRNVFADGVLVGKANELIIMGRGTFKLDLGQPANYTPGSKTVRVGGTRRSQPLTIKFNHAGANAT